MRTVFSALATALFTLLVPLVVAVLIPQRMLGGISLSSTAPLFFRSVGALLFALGVAGYLGCASLFVKAQGTPAPVFPTRRAVVSGPYRLNRNPMYTSVLAVVVGQALFYRSGRVAWYGVFLFACFHLFVVLYEARVADAVPWRIRRILQPGAEVDTALAPRVSRPLTCPIRIVPACP